MPGGEGVSTRRRSGVGTVSAPDGAVAVGRFRVSLRHPGRRGNQVAGDVVDNCPPANCCDCEMTTNGRSVDANSSPPATAPRRKSGMVRAWSVGNGPRGGCGPAVADECEQRAGRRHLAHGGGVARDCATVNSRRGHLRVGPARGAAGARWAGVEEGAGEPPPAPWRDRTVNSAKNFASFGASSLDGRVQTGQSVGQHVCTGQGRQPAPIS